MAKLSHVIDEFKFFFNSRNTGKIINLMNYFSYHFKIKRNIWVSYFKNITIISDRQSFPAFRDVFRRDDYNINLPKKNLVVLDIGANIGCASIYFLLKHNIKKIYAYEPMKENLFFLKINSQINAFDDKLKIMPFGISYKDENKFFTYEGVNSKIDPKGGLRIKLKSFDQEYKRIIKKEGLIDLVKIDIEGSEIPIIKNSNCFKEIKHLIIEIHGTKKERDKIFMKFKKMFKNVRKISEEIFEARN